MTSCRTARELPPTVNERETVTVTLRDTVILTEADTATVTALIRCTAEGRLLLERLEAAQGSRTTADIDITPSADGQSAVVTVECATDSLRQVLALRDREIERLREETHTVLVPRDFTWWQTTLMLIGSAFILILLAAVVVGIVHHIRKR